MAGLSPAEADALEWIAAIGRPFRSSCDGVDSALRSLCRRGLARVVFIRGRFYYEIKREGK